MKISVVIPAYNAASWLPDALTSVLDQSHPAEVVVVDDCSRDDTSDVASDFIARNGLTGTVLRTERNLGPGNARNLGWQAAGSDWIQFLDADDVLGPRKFEQQMAVARSVADGVAVLYSPWQRLRPANGGWRPSGQVKRSRVDSDTITDILRDTYFGYLGPTLVRRSALQDVGGFQPQMRLTEDLDLMLRIAMAGWRFRVVETAEPLFFYRDTPGSLWHTAAMDGDAAMQSCRSIRSAELFVREQQGNRLQASTRRALAVRYRRRAEPLRAYDPAGFTLVSSWIADLQVRSPRRMESQSFFSHRPLIYTMDSARLRGKFVLRGTKARLRIRHADGSQEGGSLQPFDEPI
jgi:glycosyltransferase involved in cell wall biosynthesis